MAFTENAAGFGAGTKGRIKTLEKKKPITKPVNLEDTFLNEDQAIAALSQKNLSDEDFIQKDEEKQVKKKEVKKEKKVIKKKSAPVPK